MITALSAAKASQLFTRLLLCIEHLSAEEKGKVIILEVRNILEEIYLSLTESNKQVNENLFSRIQSASLLFDLPKNTITDSHILRKYCNLQIHNADSQPTPLELECAISKLAQIVCAISNEAVPQEFKSLNSTALDRKEKPTYIQKQELPSVKIYVTGVQAGPLIGKSQRPSTIITGESTELGEIQIFCVNFSEQPSQKKGTHPNNNLADFAKMLNGYLGATVYIENLNQYGNNANHYLVNIRTNLVIAPDILLDVSDIASCINQTITAPKAQEVWAEGEELLVQDSLLIPEKKTYWINYLDNPYAYFLKKVIGTTSGPTFLKGVIVNNLLDQLIQHPNEDFDYDASFDKVLKDMVLMALKVPESTIADIKSDIKKVHLPNLQRFVRDYFTNCEILAEASFISAEFGLQGRPDVVRIQNNGIDIFELKSSKMKPYSNPYPNHAAQVAGYRLLLGNALGKERINKGVLIYSGAEETSGVYDVTTINMMLQRYSNIRNTILYGLRQIAVNQAEKLFHRIITDPENRRGFNEQNTLYLANALNNASPTVKAYYFEFLGLVMREFFSAKVGAFKSASREEGGYADLWRMSNTQKIISQRVIYGLELTQFNKAKKLLHFTFTQPIEHAFREGDLALIYLDKEFTSPSNTGGAVLKQQFLKGAIKHINSTEIYFSLRSELVPDSLLANKIGWCIEPDQMDGNTWSTVSTLTNFLSAPASVQQVILGVTPPKPPATKQYEFPEDKRLLPHQKQVITAATNANNYYLLQGPPGTGKTSTILPELVRLGLEQHNHITILAFTNKAIAEIERALETAGFDYLLLGGTEEDEGTHPRRISYLKKERTIAQLRNWIVGKRIMLSTVATFNSRKNYFTDLIQFDLLIVDEASQLLEPDLSGVLPTFNKFILIGDQNQLPAVVTQADAFCTSTNPLMQAVGLTDLRTSLFERLYKQCQEKGWHYAIGMLTDHFRMHAEIAGLINSHYNNLLTTSLQRQAASWQGYPNVKDYPIATALQAHRVLFFDFTKERKRKMQVAEAEAAVELVRFIKTYGKHPDGSPFEIGIITPFRAQIAYIKHLLCEAGLEEDILVDTVERYQGQQRDIIIYSLATNDNQSMLTIQALNQEGTTDRKLLVSLSRAKEQIIILGNRELAQTSEAYAQVINHLDSTNAYYNQAVTRNLFLEVDAYLQNKTT